VTGADTVAGFLARAALRKAVQPGDARAGAVYEHVTVDGAAYFVKRLSPASDWIMRITGDRVHRPYLVWQAGVMDRAPECIDHTVVAMDVDGEEEHAVLTMVMRDVTDFLVPEGDALVPLRQHANFIAHLAALSAAFWGWDDDIGLTTMAQRLRFFAPDNIAAELAAVEVPGPIRAAAAGWKALAWRSPLLGDLAQLIHARPGVITEPLAGTPRTFLHGDWKMGNLGTHADGRTILLDWAYPGSGPACWDLCWYLALNRARLPEPKEAVIDRFRAELEGRGVVTGGWWQSQLDLCMIGIMATFGWEKALGADDELAWWHDKVAEAAGRRGLDSAGGGSRADPYARSGQRWAEGAELVYRPIAAQLVAMSPHPLAGRVVLDAGAGTGAASVALRTRRARTIAVDLSPGMLAWHASARPPCAVADVLELPLAPRSVDDSVAAFVLNHLTHPDSGFAELARVTRPGGVILATAFSNDSRSTARDTIDALARAAGWQAPGWYVELKAAAAPILGSRAGMAAAARAAGLRGICAQERPADVGVTEPAQLVRYRLGHPAFAEWLEEIGVARAGAFAAEAEQAISDMPPYRPVVVFMAALRP